MLSAMDGTTARHTREERGCFEATGVQTPLPVSGAWHDMGAPRRTGYGFISLEAQREIEEAQRDP